MRLRLRVRQNERTERMNAKRRKFRGAVAVDFSAAASITWRGTSATLMHVHAGRCVLVTSVIPPEYLLDRERARARANDQGKASRKVDDFRAFFP